MGSLHLLLCDILFGPNKEILHNWSWLLVWASRPPQCSLLAKNSANPSSFANCSCLGDRVCPAKMKHRIITIWFLMFGSPSSPLQWNHLSLACCRLLFWEITSSCPMGVNFPHPLSSWQHGAKGNFTLYPGFYSVNLTGGGSLFNPRLSSPSETSNFKAQFPSHLKLLWAATEHAGSDRSSASPPPHFYLFLLLLHKWFFRDFYY